MPGSSRERAGRREDEADHQAEAAKGLDAWQHGKFDGGRHDGAQKNSDREGHRGGVSLIACRREQDDGDRREGDGLGAFGDAVTIQKSSARPIVMKARPAFTREGSQSGTRAKRTGGA
jgi:hypothetical protein